MWEVEVTSPRDVSEIVFSVRRDTPATTPNAHSVFSFTVHQVPVRQFPTGPSGVGGKVGSAGSRSPAGTTVGPSGVTPSALPTELLSCLRVITLANANAAPGPASLTGAAPSPGTSLDAGPPVPQWLERLNAVLRVLEERQPVAPFHKSRVTLLLRDAVLGRAHASFLGCLGPGIKAASKSFSTLVGTLL